LKAVTIRPPNLLSVEEVSVPHVGAGELLVEMKVCGLCGTDVEKLRGQYTASMPVLGHEAVGAVAEVGASLRGFKPGERVFPHHHVACRRCYFCSHGNESMCRRYRESNLDPGGFSEYIRVPAWNVRKGGVLKLPEHVTYEEASFIEPLACCIRALDRVGVNKDEVVLVVGAGPLGVTHALLLRGLGASPMVSDVNEGRLRFAESTFGLSTLNAAKRDVPKDVRSETSGRGADLAIVASGNPKALEQALRSVRKGGRVCLFGVPPKGSRLDYDISDLFNSELSVISSYAATEKETRRALELIASGRLQLSRMVTHVYPLERFEDAVRTFEEGACMKVLVVP